MAGDGPAVISAESSRPPSTLAGASLEQVGSRRRSIASIEREVLTQKPVPRRWTLSRDQARLAVTIGLIATVGTNDSAVGALLDAMKDHYAVPYSTISLVFLATVAGYFLSCLLNSHLLHLVGLRWNLVIGGSFIAVGSLVLLFAPPFPVMIVALAIMGFGEGVSDSTLTGFVSHQDKGALMSATYAGFGVGASLAPLIIGALLDGKVAWNKYFYTPLALSVFLSAIAFPVFEGYTMPSDDQPLLNTDDQPSRSSIELAALSEGTAAQSAAPRRATTSAAAAIKRLLKIKVVYLGFALIFLSFSLTNIFSSWIVSFLLEERHAPQSASRYQLAGLWGGIALGRVTLSLLSTRLGEKVFAVAIIAATCGCLIVVWVVRQVALNAVMICAAGFCMGPLTPAILSTVASRVPASLKAPAMSLTIGAGLFGSAMAPLLFGLVAQAGYLRSLPGVLIGTAIAMAVGWAFLPKNERRED